MPSGPHATPVRVAVVAVGAELLDGTVVNHNAAWLGRVLTGSGLTVTRVVAVSDDETQIVDTLADELRHAHVVVVTGGLGPTSDDRTREALARLAGVPLRRQESLVEHLRDWYARRGRVAPASALTQADVPEGAESLPNPHGSAPGVRLDVSAGVVYAVPGVPREMQAMVDAEVLPALMARSGSPAPPTRTLRTAVIGESIVATLLEPVEEEGQASGVDLAYLASVGEVRVRFTSRRRDSDAQRRLDVLVARARTLLGDVVYGEGDDTIDVVAHRLLAGSGATVAVAESLTGGLVGAALTDMPGSSDTFRGGVTAYGTDLKESQLGVDPVLLDREGPVHPEVAAQMAGGVRRRLGASFGLATTGVAGPGPQRTPRGDRLEPGTVHVAVDGLHEGAQVGQVASLRLGGEREVVRRRAVVVSLDLLRRCLSGVGPFEEPESSG